MSDRPEPFEYYLCDPVFHPPDAIPKSGPSFYLLYRPVEDIGAYLQWGQIETIEAAVGRNNVGCQGFETPQDLMSAWHGYCRRVHRHLSPPPHRTDVFNVPVFDHFNLSLPPTLRYRPPARLQNAPPPTPTSLAIPSTPAPAPAPISSGQSQGRDVTRVPSAAAPSRTYTDSSSQPSSSVSARYHTPPASMGRPSATSSAQSSTSQHKAIPFRTSSEGARAPAPVQAPAISAPSPSQYRKAIPFRKPSVGASASAPAQAPAVAASSPRKDTSHLKSSSSARAQPDADRRSRRSSTTTSASYSVVSSWVDDTAAAMANLDIQSVASTSAASRSAASSHPGRAYIVAASGVEPMKFFSKREARGAREVLLKTGHPDAIIRTADVVQEEGDVVRS